MELEMKYSIGNKDIAESIWADEYLKTIEEDNTREKVFMLSLIHIPSPRDGLLSIRRQRQMCIRDREMKYSIGNKDIAESIWADEYLKTIEEDNTREKVFM